MRTMADGVRFELTEDANPRRFSRPLHSTALPSIRISCALIIQIFAGDASVNIKSSQNRGHKGPERSVWGAKTTRAGVFSSPCVLLSWLSSAQLSERSCISELALLRVDLTILDLLVQLLDRVDAAELILFDSIHCGKSCIDGGAVADVVT